MIEEHMLEGATCSVDSSIIQPTCRSEDPYAASTVPSASLYAVAVTARPSSIPGLYRNKLCVMTPAANAVVLMLSSSGLISVAKYQQAVGAETISDLASQAVQGC